ncbi:MAG: bifunctional riboflavin kinase/FAD synthetase [Acidimicrobiia bacterium]|nr:bifunctional riboflavin kinase/FAD synthetase [Acidimicrobiia bacterium]
MEPAACPPGLEGCAVTIGAYDGVHRGHRAVIDRTEQEAARRGARTAVVTFDRHPAAVVRPESAPRLLTSLEHKLELLDEAGVDVAYVVHFDDDRAHEAAADFVKEVLVDCLRARCVVVGADFHFGRHREGTVAMLAALGRDYGFEAVGIDLLGQAEGPTEIVSSTSIRAAVASGDVESAAALLGRWHELRGVVGTGDKRGREIGFPTANLTIGTDLAIPADGIYAGWYVHPDGSRHAAAINVGRRPTFYEEGELLVEAFLLDFAGDLYGQRARVQFVARLRPEVKFDSVDELVAQMHLDVAEARHRLSPAS